jgi:hypothetical protein
MRSNTGMANRQGDVDLRFAQVSTPQLTLWLGFEPLLPITNGSWIYVDSWNSTYGYEPPITDASTPNIRLQYILDQINTKNHVFTFIKKILKSMHSSEQEANVPRVSRSHISYNTKHEATGLNILSIFHCTNFFDDTMNQYDKRGPELDKYSYQ